MVHDGTKWLTFDVHSKIARVQRSKPFGSIVNQSQRNDYLAFSPMPPDGRFVHLLHDSPMFDNNVTFGLHLTADNSFGADSPLDEQPDFPVFPPSKVFSNSSDHVSSATQSMTTANLTTELTLPIPGFAFQFLGY
jgi:hypothetical protein